MRDVAFEVDDLQAAIDRVAADGNGRKTRSGHAGAAEAAFGLPVFARRGPECRTPTGTPIALSRDFGATRIRGVP
jgi:hypothetical protein